LEIETICSAWSYSTISERHGIVIALASGGALFSYVNRCFSIDTFNPSWDIIDGEFGAPAHGTVNLINVAVILARGLPAAVSAQLMEIPVIRRHLSHLFFAPPAIYRGLEVGRPDLYWMVATAWGALRRGKYATMDSVITATDALCADPWDFTTGTVALRNMTAACRACQVVAVNTPRGGIADICIDGKVLLTIAPRDKMVLAAVLLWGSSYNWLSSIPLCAPHQITAFRAYLITNMPDVS